MAVSARPANDPPVPANPGATDPLPANPVPAEPGPPRPDRVIDLRTAPGVRAGTFEWAGADAVTGWHRHPYHQIEYALHGVAEVETTGGRYLLPPQQAIWIPAGLPHSTTLFEVRSVAVFFDPSMLPGPADRARVLAAAPVVREMIAYGVRWPIGRPASDATADRYFEVLAQLVLDWLDHEAPLWLPTTADPVVRAVMDHTDRHLATVDAASVCRAVGLSERTLRRRFPAVTGMTWRAYLLQSRLLRAMTLLAEPRRSVLDVATAVGFTSPSAFTRAFQQVTGETPSAYRRRGLEPGGRQTGAAPG
jgi:AraC-like DNA-binding protein/quercetin dioxygenase-like cupin family protein